MLFFTLAKLKDGGEEKNLGKSSFMSTVLV